MDIPDIRRVEVKKGSLVLKEEVEEVEVVFEKRVYSLWEFGKG
jgi:putative transposon-encoded protein|nr:MULTISPECIES: hypothetical protein [unclassified Archaeoglobus]